MPRLHGGALSVHGGLKSPDETLGCEFSPKARLHIRATELFQKTSPQIHRFNLSDQQILFEGKAQVRFHDRVC